MKSDKVKFDHLINNLEKTSFRNSIFNYQSGQRAFLALGQVTNSEWLKTLLPNTRLIIEPKIIGSSIGIQYINGKLNKAINKRSEDITEEVKHQINVPKNIAIKNRIEVQGVLYDDGVKFDKNIKTEFNKASIKRKEFSFCAFQIFHCKINQFNALQELKNLNFEIPETQFTNFITDIEIYLQCWKEGKLFQNYPTSGIVLKINSRKLQKYLGENNLSIPWAYAIN